MTAADIATSSDVLSELFPNANSDGGVRDRLAQGSFVFEDGAPKAAEEKIAERFPTPEALAEFDPDMLVSVYGFERSAVGAAAPELRTFAPRPISQAVPLYHQGHTIVCWRLLDHLPEAQRRGADILEALGMPRHAVSARGLHEPWSNKRLFVTSLVFSSAHSSEKSSSDGSGLGIHFDKFDSVVVHLRGKKKWRVGTTPDLLYPIFNEDDANRLGFPPSLPRRAARPDALRDLEEIEMRRGSTLLLPRGTFHTTMADGESSLSLGYHFVLPTWADVVLAALQQKLTQEPVMRMAALDAFGPSGPSAAAREQMSDACSRAMAALSDPDELLEDGLLAHLAGPRQAAFAITNSHAQAPPSRPAPSPEIDGLWTWARSRRDHPWFRLEEALAVVGASMSPQEAWNVLQEWVEEGALTRRWGMP